MKKIKSIALILILVVIAIITTSSVYAQVQLHGIQLGYGSTTVNVTSDTITVNTLDLSQNGIATGATQADEVRTYSFTSANTPVLSTAWNGQSSSESDWQILTPSVTDAIATITGTTIASVKLDNGNSPFNFDGVLNTIQIGVKTIVNIFFFGTTGGGGPQPPLGGVGGGSGTPLPVINNYDQINNTIRYIPVYDTLPLAYSKPEQIQVDWPAGKSVSIIAIHPQVQSPVQLLFSDVTPIQLNKDPNGVIKTSIVFTAITPKSYCTNEFLVNCINPQNNTEQIPLEIESMINGRLDTQVVNVAIKVTNQPAFPEIPLSSILIIMMAVTGIVIILVAAKRRKKTKKPEKRIETLLKTKGGKNEQVQEMLKERRERMTVRIHKPQTLGKNLERIDKIKPEPIKPINTKKLEKTEQVVPDEYKKEKPEKKRFSWPKLDREMVEKEIKQEVMPKEYKIEKKKRKLKLSFGRGKRKISFRKTKSKSYLPKEYRKFK